MTQVFKVLKDFELDGEAVRSGQEVVCRSREADKLQKEGFLVPVDRELDPNTKKDAALIAKSEDRAGKRHSDIKATESEKEEKKNEREAEKDAERVKLLEEAGQLFAKVFPDTELPDFTELSDKKLAKEVETLRSQLEEKNK